METAARPTTQKITVANTCEHLKRHDSSNLFVPAILGSNVVSTCCGFFEFFHREKASRLTVLGIHEVAVCICRIGWTSESFQFLPQVRRDSMCKSTLLVHDLSYAFSWSEKLLCITLISQASRWMRTIHLPSWKVTENFSMRKLLVVRVNGNGTLEEVKWILNDYRMKV